MSQVDFVTSVDAFAAPDIAGEDAKRAAAARDARHLKLKRWFEASEEATRESRLKAERDRDYYDNKQLTDSQIKELEGRGQPPIAINLIRRKVDFLRGMEVKQRTDPKAWPRTPGDADAAEVATDTLRYVFDAANYNNMTRKWVWKDLLVVGWGGVQLQKRPGRADQITRAMGVAPNTRFLFRRVPWDRMFWDPHSADHDFNDARYRGLVVWMDEPDAKDAYGGDPVAAALLDGMLSTSARGNTFDDKPRSQWLDSTRRRIRIVQIWWKEAGRVFWAEFCEAGILKEGESEFVDGDGEPCDNFIWQSCYVDRDNNRHGIVRDMIDPQDEINKRRSKSLHLLTVRQVISDEGAVQDVEKAKRQLARPDGWITKAPGLDLQIVQNGDLSAGQMQLLQHATAELEKMGPNEALQGQGSATSGLDRQAQQQGGLIELGPTMDDLMWLDHRCYVLTWATIQRTWTAPQFIRITDNEEAPKFIGLNEPMVMPDGAIAGARNQPAQINVDIIIQPVPDTTALEQQIWTDLANLMPVLVSSPPPMQEFIIEASPLPASRKRRLMEILKKAQQPQDPRQAQMAQMAAQVEMRGRVAQATDREAAAILKQAQARKLMQEAQAATPPAIVDEPTVVDIERARTEQARQAAIVAGVGKTQADIDYRRAQAFAVMNNAF